MKAFITTVAGNATRFIATLPKPIPKCIYTNTNPKHTLLYRLLNMVRDYDCIVVVGGFKIDMLREYIENNLPTEIFDKILLVNNTKYDIYGSGWSLYLGIKALMKTKVDYSEVIFAEGDLFFDRDSFELIKRIDADVITVNQEPITAKKSVAIYYDTKGIPHFIYDTKHGAMEIREPFTSIYNSGQVWKFCNVARLFGMTNYIGEEAHKGTNLILINNYFSDYMKNQVVLKQICFNTWVNTNTTEDFEQLIFDYN